MIDSLPKDIQNELSRRAKAYRIAYPMTQNELADKSGVSLRAIQNFESQKEIKLDIFIKIMIALGLEDNIINLIPDMNDRPSAMLAKSQGLEKKRVRKKKNIEQTNRNFKWGDER